jgi:hypothetical protein
MKKLYLIIATFTLFSFSFAAYAEEKKMNLELTGYLPGLGMEYQWDEQSTIGINYSAPFQSVNIHTTYYLDGTLNGGVFGNVFLGYFKDKGDKTGVLSAGRYVYAGLVGGYQWMLESGINFNVDAGLMLAAYLDAEAVRVLPLPAFAASVGYAFSLGE